MKPHNETKLIIEAMSILSRTIKTDDGVANLLCGDAANRLQEQEDEITALKKVIKNGKALSTEVETSFKDYINQGAI